MELRTARRLIAEVDLRDLPAGRDPGAWVGRWELAGADELLLHFKSGEEASVTAVARSLALPLVVACPTGDPAEIGRLFEAGADRVRVDASRTALLAAAVQAFGGSSLVAWSEEVPESPSDTLGVGEWWFRELPRTWTATPFVLVPAEATPEKALDAFRQGAEGIVLGGCGLAVFGPLKRDLAAAGIPVRG